MLLFFVYICKMKRNDIKKLIDDSGKKTIVNYEGKELRKKFDESIPNKMKHINEFIVNQEEDVSRILNGDIGWSDFFNFKEKFNHIYGDIRIDKNLIEIHTGGWSENEEYFSDFKNTLFYKLHFSHMSTGGHFYLDTDKNNTNAHHWVIKKTI